MRRLPKFKRDDALRAARLEVERLSYHRGVAGAERQRFHDGNGSFKLALKRRGESDEAYERRLEQRRINRGLVLLGEADA